MSNKTELINLLTEGEIRELQSIKFYGACIDLYTEITDLTVKELSNIALILIKSEYSGRMPECVLSAEAINILTKRAIKQNLPIF